MDDLVSEPQQPHTVRDSDLLRVLVALAGRLAFPPGELAEIVGPYVAAYNMCTGELSLASIARATTIDKSNLRKAILRWEQAGVVFRVGPEGRPLRLYPLSVAGGGTRSKARAVPAADSAQSVDGGIDGQEQ